MTGDLREVRSLPDLSDADALRAGQYVRCSPELGSTSPCQSTYGKWRQGVPKGPRAHTMSPPLQD